MAVEIATGYVSIVPSMKGFTSKLSADVSKSAALAGDESGKKFSSGMMQHIKGLAVAFAGAFAVTKGLEFFKSSIKEASDLNESVNAVNVTFGKSAKGIQKLSSDAATAMGLSKTEFNSLAVRFSNFADTVAGKGGDVVGTMKELTGRAADFASVMNLDVADAAELFQSGLAGETEPLRKYGIDLSAAKVSAYAYANGIAKTGTELTESQKVQARYALLMQQTAKTQGDFANTSDGLANKQRIMNAEWKNAKASIGSSLMPVMQSLVGFIADKVVPAVQSFGDWFKSDGGPAIANFGATLRDTVLPPLQSVVGWLVQNKDVILPIAGIIAAMVAAYKTWAFVSALVTAAQVALNFALTANPIGVIVMAIAGLIAGLVLAYNKVGWFRDLVDGAFQWIKSVTEAVWPTVQAVITKVWDVVKWYVTTYIGIIRSVIETVWPWIQKATQIAWSAIKTFIIEPVKAAWQVVSFVLSNAREGMSIIWTAIKTRASNAWQAIKDNIISPIVRVHERLVEIVGNVRDWLSGAWTTVKDRAATAWGNIKDAILEPLRGLWGFFKTILGIGDNGIDENGPLGRLIGIFGRVKDRIGDAFSGIKDLLVTPIIEAFKWINTHVIDPLNTKLLDKIKAPNIPNIPIPDGYATGGLVRGSGTGTSDSILARLSNGEFVVNAKAAAANRATLEAINSGRPGSNTQSATTSGFNPVGWLKGLMSKGAEASVKALTGLAMPALRAQFGGSTGGNIAVGAAQWLFDGLAEMAKKLMMAPTQLMENLARYFEAMVDRNAFVGYHTCLANVNAAMAHFEQTMGFATNGWLDLGTAAETTAAVQRAGLMRHTTPPRGAIVLWDTSIGRSGHIAVADGKGFTMNNWGGSTVEKIANIGSSVGWTPPESFIVGNGYDSGGYLPPGWSMNYNGTGRPEPVLTSDQWDAIGRSGVTNNWTVYAKEEPTVDTVMRSWRQWEALQAVG